ncbi:DUF4232 domain-containing protein [Streptomyces sp. NPDC052687]|uniref:DUF4232 domain-containing protein n=1 Tax=Streptomyces sp. NPDC052687 TaxID=3154759 RepID=UPI00343FD134
MVLLPSPSRPPAFVVTVCALGLLTACGDGGTAGAAGAAAQAPAASASPSPATASSPAASRCRTPDLRASVGRNDPGAGQENHPILLTNTSSRTCTLHGYPGAAFADASGRQLGPDPRRRPESPARLRLAPGGSAWAGLSYADPRISGARTAVPAVLLVTPPGEREPLRVPWSAGEVPVGGNESAVTVTVLRAGDVT